MTAVPAAFAQTPKPGTQLRTLEDALPLIRWESRTRGPLVAIAPETVAWLPPRRDGSPSSPDENADDEVARRPLLAPADAYGLSADRVARHFERKLIHLPTLTVFAPPKMALLHADLKPANPSQGAELPDQMRHLEATLTPAQWKRLGSEGGLGIGDLTPEQQPLFEAVLPEEMTIRRETINQAEDGMVYNDSAHSAAPQTLTPEQRLGVRLHVARRAFLQMVDAKNEGILIDNPFHSTAVGTQVITRVPPSHTDATEAVLFGQRVRTLEPNRLKPGDLDLKQPALQETYVALTGVKTVGDLIKAVRTKTEFEIYADDRLARLPVALSGVDRSVRAADLLEALCWALTATYRKVGPIPGGDPKDFAYVLTYDRTGLLALRGAIDNWAGIGGLRREKAHKDWDAAIKTQSPGQYLDYDKDDLLAPRPEALQALRDSAKESSARLDDSGERTVPLSVLTPAQRQQLNDGLRLADKGRKEDSKWPQAKTDRVALTEFVGAEFLLPGVGTIRDDNSWGDGPISDTDSLDDVNKAVRVSASRKTLADQRADLREHRLTVARAIVCVTPKAADDLEPLFLAAHSLGIDEVWVKTSDGDGEQSLAACIAAGHAHGVKVGAQLTLIDAPAATVRADSSAEDRTSSGETASERNAEMRRLTDGLDMGRYAALSPFGRERDLFAPEAPATRAHLTQRLRAIAALPGLAAISLHKVAAQGRDWTAKPSDNEAPGDWDFGYTVANRLAFLRANGYDPIDLSDNNRGYSDGKLRDALTLPQFDINGSELHTGQLAPPPDIARPIEAWRIQRIGSNSEMLRALRADLRTHQPALPVYLGSYNSDSDYSTVSEYQRWDDSAALPFAADTPAAPVKATPASSHPPTVPESLLCFSFGTAISPTVQGMAYEVGNSSLPMEDVPVADLFALTLQARLKERTKGSTLPEKTEVLLDFGSLPMTDTLTMLKEALLSVKIAGGK